MRSANRAWVRYYGPPFRVPFVSYCDALDATAVPDAFFRDRIVFIGARPMAGLFHERRDEARSPFSSWRDPDRFMPAVEVHATQLLNLLREDGLQRPVPIWEVAGLGLAALLGGLLVWLRPLPGAVVAGGAIASLTGASAWLFEQGHVWFPWLIVAAVQWPAALGASVLYHSVDWYRTRRRLEAAQRAAQAIIREQAALIDKAHDAICVQALDGRIVYANPAAQRLYGWSSAPLPQAQTVNHWLALDANRATEAARLTAERGEWNGELRLQTRDGRRVMVDSRWTLIRDDAGRPRARLIIGSDITEKKQLEAEMLRAQRLDTLGALAGGMAHDLNNALSPVLMGAQLLQRRQPDPETARLIALMESSAQRAAEMVRQVLLFARGRDGEQQRVSPAALLKEIERLVRETFPRNITVETYVASDVWPVRGNPTQLHQVLLNLCVNARDAMPNGGRLTLATDNAEFSAADAAAEPECTPGQYVSFLVSDTGTGMTPEVLARLFEPFFTTKGEGRGTGLGLATVRRLVQNHGGRLRVESSPGAGTTVEVLLPRATATETERTRAGTPDLPQGQGELVLVVEDELAIRELVTEALETQGYRVLGAADGPEALGLFHRHAEEVRLVFADSTIPSPDGPSLLAALRQRKPALPIVLATGQAEADEPEEADPADPVVRLAKPFSLVEVLQAVGRCLEPPRRP
jgi:PAS domain S-box-containing protein